MSGPEPIGPTVARWTPWKRIPLVATPLSPTAVDSLAERCREDGKCVVAVQVVWCPCGGAAGRGGGCNIPDNGRNGNWPSSDFASVPKLERSLFAGPSFLWEVKASEEAL